MAAEQSETEAAKGETGSVKPGGGIEALLRRDRALISAVLAAVIIICWLYLLAGAGTGMYPHRMAELIPSMPGMDGSAQSGGRTSSSFAAWTPGYALVMFSMWWLMMIAMMLPSAAPMMLLHAAVTRNAHTSEKATRDKRSPTLPTTAFAAGYLVAWGVFSVVAVTAQWFLARQELLSPMMVSTSRLFGSGLLLAAGMWQLTPLKSACLQQCRSPVGFVSAYWRPGIGGAFAMGLRHGAYCLGCCWFLMALLFYGGVMNLVWIAGLALVVLVEKTLPHGDLVGKAIGVLFIAWGLWVGLSTG